MMRLFIIFVLSLFITSSFCQDHIISGRVIDRESRSPLPFVNVVVNRSNMGGTTDIDGRFFLRSPEKIEMLSMSYVGYEPVTYNIDDYQGEILIQLKKAEYELPEIVVYPTENPAHRIINNAIANRYRNDPEKLPEFTYTAYDKMIFTLDPDSLLVHDTLFADTSQAELRDFLDNHHLFMMESVAERRYMFNGRNKEEVIATKVSGFKDPIFVFLISHWQSTSFYSDQIEIAGSKYVNPISPGSTRRYFFLLQDTLLFGEQDTTFVISFRPGLRTNFAGLKGTLSINTRNWAVQNVIAEPAEEGYMFTFRVEQMYELIDGEQWFPVQINNVAILNQVVVGDSSAAIVLGTVRDTTGKRIVSLPFGMGKRYIRDIDLNPGLRKRDFGNTEVLVNPHATSRNEAFWDNYRVDSLTQKELNTYHYIDSIGQEENLDRFARNIESLLTGKIPWGYFNFDMHRFFRLNAYEGFAPGLGLETSDKLSQTFKTGGYIRYGFKDDAFKWGANLGVLLYNPADLQLKFSYMDDVSESAGVRFWDDKPTQLNTDNFREFLIRDMDKVVEYRTSIEFQTIRYLNVSIGLNKSRKTVTNDYRYAIRNESVNVFFEQFDFTELAFGFRYAYREKFIRNMRRKISLGTNYPIVWVQYSRGIAGLLDGDFNYNRVDFKIEKSFTFKYLGVTSLRLNAGYVDEDIPYTNLYNGNGSYRVFTIYAPNSFATMRMNEFMLSRYGSLYFQHDFKNLLWPGIGFLKPEFAIASAVGFGSLKYPESHYNMDYKTMERGYFESGLLVNNLLRLPIYSIGLGGFYRYGPYAFAGFKDNVAYKVTIQFRLGL